MLGSGAPIITTQQNVVPGLNSDVQRGHGDQRGCRMAIMETKTSEEPSTSGYCIRGNLPPKKFLGRKYF